VGAGLICALSRTGGCEGAAWILPAVDVVAAGGGGRRYGPDRNGAVEATLLAAGAAAAAAAAEASVAADAVAGTPAPERLAAAVAALLASPAGLDPILPTTVRAVTLTAPAAAAATAAGRSALASDDRPPEGTYELQIEYTCLSLELYPTTTDATTRTNRNGSTVWVEGSVLPLGAAVAGGEVGTNVLLVVQEREAAERGEPTPLLACGTATVGGAAVRVSTDAAAVPTVSSWAVGDRCGRIVDDDATPGGVRLDCSAAVRGGRRVQSVAVAAAVMATPSAIIRSVGLLAAAAGHAGPAAVSPRAQRLRIWGVGNGVAGGGALRSAATTATARAAVTASAVDELPRLDAPAQLVIFTFLPAVGAGLLAVCHTAAVRVGGATALLPVPPCPLSAAVKWVVFAIEVAAAAVAVGGAVQLGGGFGAAAARGYVAVEEGGVLLQEAATPGVPGGPVLVVTAVPVVEGVLVRVGSRRGAGLVRAAAVLGAADLVWDAGFLAASLAVAWRARRAATAGGGGPSAGGGGGGGDGGGASGIGGGGGGEASWVGGDVGGGASGIGGGGGGEASWVGGDVGGGSPSGVAEAATTPNPIDGLMAAAAAAGNSPRHRRDSV